MEDKIIKMAKKLESINYELSKMNIFQYDTLDEADPKLERIRSDVTVEIGGPSAHIKFVVLTRAEHTQVKNLVEKILNDRLEKIKFDLKGFCEQYLRNETL